ncbi:MAG: hypothetical protein DHS20C14_08650 [Phycisphaeraceae bacterium]|nr:MAG: hypothetical protein DHS20C14_08650 [Phycisphaeraceae bacterium]
MPERARASAGAIVRERCAELSLAVWRLEPSGRVTQSPEATPAQGITEDTLREAVLAWADAPEPAPVRIDSGHWLLPIPEVVRRERTGYLVAVAPEDPNAPGGGHTETTARALHRMLAWMWNDVDLGENALLDLDRFSTQMTEAYETIHTLYGIGRAMGQLTQPDHFVRGMVEELHDTLPFGWLACLADADATGNPEIDGIRFTSGTFPGDDRLFARVHRYALGELARAPGDGALIIDRPDDIPEALGPQIVAQPVRRAGKLVAVLVAASKGGEEPQVSSYETLMLEAAGGFLGAFLDNTALYAEQEEAFVGTVRAMTAAIDAKDRYTRGHSERVAMLSKRLAEAAGLDAAAVHEVYISGLVHDVGKIGVPERVLCKTGRLTDEEFDLIREHPGIGHEILKVIPSLASILPGVMHHHERWDGNGYPARLSGTDIPLMARIIGLADTFDAMSSTRSYRPAMTRDVVLAEITRCAGSQFDPDLAKVFDKVDLSEYDALVAEHKAADPTFEQDTGPRLKAA